MKNDYLNNVNARAGFALVEMMIGSAAAVLLFGGMLVTLIAQQRGFIAALYQMDSQADQSRVMVYMSRDLRDATAVQISTDGSEVTLTVPVSTAPPTLNLNLGLSFLSLLSPPPPAQTTTISYYRQGTGIIRQVGAMTTQLSNSATQFQVTRNGTCVWTTMAFQPCFSINPNASTAAATQVSSCTYLLNASLP